MKKINIVVLLAVITSSIFLSGCWDSREIDKVAFVSTIGIGLGDDVGGQSEVGDYDLEVINPNRSLGRYNVVYGYPDMSEVSAGGSQAITSQSIKIKNAISIGSALRQVQSKSSRVITQKHAKLLLISEDVFKYPVMVREITDYFMRNGEVNRNLKVIITKGDPEDYANFTPHMERTIEGYISGIVSKWGTTPKMFSVSLIDFVSQMGEEGSVLLPIIDLDKSNNLINIEGMAVVHDFELRGSLDPRLIKDVGVLSGGVDLTDEIVFDDGVPIDYDVHKIKRTIEIVNKDPENLEVLINIEMQGKIEGYSCATNPTTEKVQEIQMALSNNMSREFTMLVKDILNRFDVEIFGIKEHIQRFEPSLWEEIKYDQKEALRNAKVVINVNAIVDSVGELKLK